MLVRGVLDPDLDPLLQRRDRRRGRGRRGYSLRLVLQAMITDWVNNLHSIVELLRTGSLRSWSGSSR